MNTGDFVGEFAKVGGVMSPTSYRAAPPRTEWCRGNLLHSANPVNRPVERAAHSAHRKYCAWDLKWDLSVLAEGPRNEVTRNPLPLTPSNQKESYVRHSTELHVVFPIGRRNEKAAGEAPRPWPWLLPTRGAQRLCQEPECPQGIPEARQGGHAQDAAQSPATRPSLITSERIRCLDLCALPQGNRRRCGPLNFGSQAARKDVRFLGDLPSDSGPLVKRFIAHGQPVSSPALGSSFHLGRPALRRWSSPIRVRGRRVTGTYWPSIQSWGLAQLVRARGSLGAPSPRYQGSSPWALSIYSHPQQNRLCRKKETYGPGRFFHRQEGGQFGRDIISNPVLEALGAENGRANEVRPRARPEGFGISPDRFGAGAVQLHEIRFGSREAGNRSRSHHHSPSCSASRSVAESCLALSPRTPGYGEGATDFGSAFAPLRRALRAAGIVLVINKHAFAIGGCNTLFLPTPYPQISGISTLSPSVVVF